MRRDKSLNNMEYVQYINGMGAGLSIWCVLIKSFVEGKFKGRKERKEVLEIIHKIMGRPGFDVETAITTYEQWEADKGNNMREVVMDFLRRNTYRNRTGQNDE